MKYNNKGVTFVELVIAMGIMAVIITAIFSFFISSLKTFNRADDHIQAQNNAQTAMNRIVDDIIGGEELLSRINDDAFRINEDTVIRYEYDDQTLRRGIGTLDDEIEINSFINNIATTPFADNITSFDISPRGDNGVTISITSRINDAEVELTNEVYLRNGKN